jgi:hypothetical protein
MVIMNLSPMYHILTRQVLEGKYFKWIVILQEFNLKFAKSKDKKSLVFAELIYDLPHADEDTEPNDSLPNESLFLISMSDPWYGDILLYLQTQQFQPNISHEEHSRIRHHYKHYLIIGDTLYHLGIDTILRRCLTHDEDEHVLNDSTLDLVAATFLGWLQLRKYYVPVIFVPPSSKIVLRLSNDAHPTKFFTKRNTPTVLCFIPFSPSTPFQNRALILCNVSLPQQGAWLYHRCH